MVNVVTCFDITLRLCCTSTVRVQYLAASMNIKKCNAELHLALKELAEELSGLYRASSRNMQCYLKLGGM